MNNSNEMRGIQEVADSLGITTRHNLGNGQILLYITGHDAIQHIIGRQAVLISLIGL